MSLPCARSLTFLFLLFLSFSLAAQTLPVNRLNTDNYDSFKIAIRPLIEEMATKRIVALGEGTHGTSEFYKVRFWITRILIEEKGFTQAALENDYSDLFWLNQELNQPGAEVKKAMKKHLLSIWQNEETSELVSYLTKDRSQGHLKLSGIDYNYVLNDVLAIRQLLGSSNEVRFGVLLDSLQQFAFDQDSIWNNTNRKGFKPDVYKAYRQGHKAWQIIDSLQRTLATMPFDDITRTQLQHTLLNSKLFFNAFRGNASRDSIMAVMATALAGENDKLIIWAHNAHIGRQQVFDAGNGGGMGGFIERIFPGNYYALGTGTATGTYAATTDRFDTRYNDMKPYKLDKPLKNSWEALFLQAHPYSFFIDSAHLQLLTEKRPMRFIGYRPSSGKSSYRPTDIKSLFDGYLFIPATKAAGFMR